MRSKDPTHLSNLLTTQTLLKSIYQNDFSFYIYSNECLEGDETNFEPSRIFFIKKKQEKKSDTGKRHQEEEERTLKIRQRDEKR